MDLSMMGSGGAGFVWGWMLAPSGDRRWPQRDAKLVAFLGSMALLIEVAALTNVRAVGACASAGLLGTGAAHAWRRRLRAAWLRATKREGA